MSELENNPLAAVDDSLKKASSVEQTANQAAEGANAFINGEEEEEEEDLDAVSAANNVIEAIDKDSNDATLGANPTPNKTTDRRKIAIKFIQNKTKRHVTFSKRKHGIMKKAYELSVLTGTQVLLLVVSETGLVYTFTTPKFQPIVTEPEGKNLIQTCLNTPDGEEEEEEDDDDDDEEDANNNNNNNGAGEEEGAEEDDEDEEGDDAGNSNNGQGSHHQYAENSGHQYHHPSNIPSHDQFGSNIDGQLALEAGDEVHQNKRLKLNDNSFQTQGSNPETLIA